MATKISLSPYHHSSATNQRQPPPFTTPAQVPNKKRFTFFCSSSKRAPSSPSAVAEEQKNQSLAEQLLPLSITLLSDNNANKTQLLSKPKSTWVNPTKPKPSILSLHRHKRSTYSYNPQMKDLREFSKKLNECEESEFLAVVEGIPTAPSRENMLFLLNGLRPWQKSLLFFNWVKAQNLFPIETIFYNVTMKSLRFGRQFQHIEELALEMIENGIEFDNITYSTIITCAKRCNIFDKAVEWFERMYKTGLMPDEVTYSAVLDVYAKLGKVEEVLSLYEKGRASGWKPDPIDFAVLGKLFGEAGDYDGIRYVLQEMKSLGVQPNLVLYNTLLEAMGKVGKPGLARSLFEEMVELGVTPNEKTLTALIKIYGRARWVRDALELWERMKLNGWPVDFILYNTLLSMCADLGLVEEGERLFEDMKGSQKSKPDSWSYTAMLNIYGSAGNVDKAMVLFKEMSEAGVNLNVMGCTCLIQCLGRAKKIDDLVKMFKTSVDWGVKPDDRLCGCLLSVVSYCDGDDANKVLSCLELANPKLVALVKLLSNENITNLDIIREEFKGILNSASVEARRPFCNCLIDICRNRNLHARAHDLLCIGSMYGLYPGLHTKTQEEWRLNVRSLSVGAAHTAFEEWMGTLAKIIEQEETLPALFTANTGAGTHKFSQGLGSAFASHMEKLAVPFRESEEKAGFFFATREDLVEWVQSKASSAAA
ncbi:pentatricopeptide repeat-containing protein At5g46580, chloroplastic-like [Primulina huaijiensis]|uniref:pentatricopeptide repeat-containing protein At5g46580, chloroplastic-like n=1 Tax=Primulina huaijiensis TaxID=1492673 RepID=UPI003CC709CB